jgi:hypothetical protein
MEQNTPCHAARCGMFLMYAVIPDDELMRVEVDAA